ncbi:class I SAM-dependent methyltransferase [Pedobacter sp. MC2016-15]|uniref:class I SAM-dependent methyltransferase n=1 Tax=Pedobacter sp. MC2016-15 TaxID=2994473 RepID=UPI002246808E|nr:class I SAM-dependent methyltransferase [Pedobacter sp. MC2016-15]MCX2478607.1 class I SAM-dependent methyltransferase [Pedobacter sp. MC2016-15]
MDVFGNALQDHFNNNTAETLWLHNSYDEPEEMPVDIFFRTEEEMPDIELEAMDLCEGRVLDVGGGAGSHALILQERGFDVVAIDLSPSAVEIMQERGVQQAVVGDIFSYSGEKFDTLLFLMNGIGLTGTVEGFKTFINHAKTLLNEGGQLLFDSSDITYLYEDTEKPTDKYYGEVSYQYEYQGEKGEWFNWIYIDPILLKQIARESGWECHLLFDDGQDQYLAEMRLPQ